MMIKLSLCNIPCPVALVEIVACTTSAIPTPQVTTGQSSTEATLRCADCQPLILNRIIDSDTFSGSVGRIRRNALAITATIASRMSFFPYQFLAPLFFQGKFYGYGRPLTETTSFLLLGIRFYPFLVPGLVFSFIQPTKLSGGFGVKSQKGH